MALLVDVFSLDEQQQQRPTLKRRQSPLMIEDKLMMVMDLDLINLMDETIPIKSKDLQEFMRKYQSLTKAELKSAFEISKDDVLSILSESVPCVGCRRSVERLYSQLMEIGQMALDPLQVVKDSGTLVIKEETLLKPKVVCSILHYHSERLTSLVDNQPRSKKSRRCVLHSWDLQKSRPVTPAWRDVWEAMYDKCKAEVLLIDFSMLLSKLENYLKKHRFCGECRTKVMKAYELLVKEEEPNKEKGFVPALYQKIKRCLPGKHIHLPTDTAYIDSLIARAEPELMGNRRERHAKTMEIAQEEVLTCVGICIYDRLQRIFLRLREEEFTCRVLAAVSIEALCRSFETAVEKKSGTTRLELLFEEITKEEQARQQKKDMKKLKKKRKKEKKQEVEVDDKDSCECESDDLLELPEEDTENVCECPKVKPPVSSERHKLQILDRKSKGSPKCFCKDCARKNSNDRTTNQECEYNKKDKIKWSCQEDVKFVTRACDGGKPAVVQNGNTTNKTKETTNTHCQSCISAQQADKNSTWIDHDHGYSSENNNVSSSCNSTPEGSEVACSEGFCEHEGVCSSEKHADVNKTENNCQQRFSLTLEKMLEHTSSSDDEECFIPAEEIQAFKAKSRQVVQKRLELRQTLKDRFHEMCELSKQTNIPAPIH